MQTADLQLFSGNPRRGNVDLIAKSLSTSGQYRPIVVNVGTHTGRFEAHTGIVPMLDGEPVSFVKAT